MHHKIIGHIELKNKILSMVGAVQFSFKEGGPCMVMYGRSTPKDRFSLFRINHLFYNVF